MTTTDNGVNVQALLDARAALTDAPQAAQFTWDATARAMRAIYEELHARRP